MTNLNRFETYTDGETFAKIVDFSNVTEMWEHSVRTYGERSAVVDGTDYTYRALDAEVAAFRTVLKGAGVKAGDAVGILAPNSVGFIKAYLAVNTYGAAAVLLPAHLDAMTVFGCSMKFGLKAIVYDASLEASVSLAREKNPALALIDVSTTADTSTPSVSPATDSLSTVIFTGGTTGKSKGARLSHRAVMYGTKNGCYGYRDVFCQRYFLVLPLTHVFGLIRNTLTSLYTGSSLFICRNPKNMFKDIAVHRPTIMILVPALAEMALNLSKQFGKNMLGEDMKTIICGAAPVPPYLVREYASLGITLLPGYGLTESANLVSGNPEAMQKPESVGLIYPGMEYRIVADELWLKGVNMMDGYFDSEENEGAYEDGWFKTGDLVRIDEEGYLYITGRIKEIIVLASGENVSPAELEVKFYALDGVQDCFVYDITENGVQQLVLEVVPRMAALKALGVEDVGAYLMAQLRQVNDTLPAFEKINKFIIRDSDFVRTPAMKIARKENGTLKK
ncbi:MAG: acyl--CoA ligase [Ruminococcaceae bacterium]|nr:acyl--CoA ligase [Oscillospiraceae bacterium]